MIFNPCNKCIVRPCCSEECDASVHRNGIIKIAKDTVILVGKLALASVAGAGLGSITMLLLGAILNLGAR
jgi:hypothetical protein